MKMDRDFDKDEISESFRLAKFKHTKSARLILNLSYGVNIQLSRKTPLTFDSIKQVTIRRIWSNGITPQYPQIGKVKPLDPDHFLPKTFAYVRQNNVGRSLALLVILSLKTAYDEVRKAERPGLLFLSEIFKLDKMGLWNEKDCKLDNFVSRIQAYWNHKNKKVKTIRTEDNKKTHRYDSYPLVDEFLIDGQEIYNLVCWRGGNKGNTDDPLIEEKVWVLNADPSQVRVFTPGGSELGGETLRATLNAIFPEQTLITESNIREYQEALAEGKTPFFQNLQPVAGTEIGKQQTKEIPERWKTVEHYAQPKPPEIVNFDRVFALHPKSAFVGRADIKRQLDDFVQHSKPNSKYFLIVGDADVGKTAIICNYLVDQRVQPVHYFIEWRNDELDSPTKFFGHIYHALSHNHGLEPQQLSNDPGVIIEALKHRIEEISKTRMSPSEREIIFVDGLNEAATTTVAGNTISDLLLFDLPDNFGIVISSRQMPELNKFITPTRDNVIYLERNNERNLSDVAAYINLTLGDRITNSYQTVNDKANNPRWIEKLVSKTGGNFRYATLLVEMVLQENMTLYEAYRRAPRGLEGLYQQRLRALEKKIGDRIKIQQIRDVMRMISILRSPHTPEEICDYLGIDYLDIESIFGALEPFLDLHTYLQSTVCNWNHVSFYDFVLDPKRFPYREQHRFHLMIASCAIRAIQSGETDDVPEYCIQHFLTHYRLGAGSERLLQFARTELLPVICDLPEFPLGIDEVYTLAAIATRDGNLGEQIFFWVFFYSFMATLHDSDHGNEPGLTKPLKGFEKTRAKLMLIEDPVALVKSFGKEHVKKHVWPSDVLWLANRLRSMLKDELTDLKSIFNTCNSLYESSPKAKRD